MLSNATLPSAALAEVIGDAFSSTTPVESHACNWKLNSSPIKGLLYIFFAVMLAVPEAIYFL